MAISGTPPISLSQVGTELGLSPPFGMNDTTVRALAGKPTGAYSMSDFLGKSSFGLTLSVGGQTQQTVGNKFIVYRRVITATINGIAGTPTYTWTNKSTYNATSMSASGSPTVTLSLSVDPNDFESNSFDNGTITCSIVNGDGRTATVSASWSLG